MEDLSRRSLVHALVALGLTEIDAWNCVHHASDCTSLGGQDSFVLLQYQQPPLPPNTDPFDDVTAELIAAAADHGAAYRAMAPGQWQYLRRMNWCVEQLCQLQSELADLARAVSGEDEDS